MPGRGRVSVASQPVRAIRVGRVAVWPLMRVGGVATIGSWENTNLAVSLAFRRDLPLS